ncbi:transporter, partial [Helicobacter pylori]|nr:transporter [Helicobacter pylori]
MFENALKYCKEKAIDLLTGFVPKTYSMTEECNILGLYDDTFIITKQENLVAIMSLQGLSYSNLMQKDLESYFDTRQNVLNTISKDIQ